MSFPRYPKYKDSGVEWLGEVPAHWELCRVKHALASMGSGGTPDTDNPEFWGTGDAADGVPWVAIGDMSGRDCVDVTEKSLTPLGIESRRMAVWPNGTLLFSMYASLGHVAELRMAATTNQAILALVPNAGTAQGFLKRWFEFLRPGLREHASSNTQDNLNAEKVRNLPVVRPPLFEQVLIAEFLDRETAKIDALVAEQRRLMELLKEKRQAVISHAVTKGLNPDAPMKPSGIEWLGDVPAHWELRRLKHISTRISGRLVYQPAQYFDAEGVPFLMGNNVTERGIKWEDLKFIPQAINNTFAHHALREGDVITVRVGAPGVTCVVPKEADGLNCGSLMIIRRSPSFDSHWLATIMNSFLVRTQIDGVQYGAAQEQINITDAVNFLIPTPSLVEQQAVALFVRAETAKFDSLIDEAQRAIDLLQERRTALISAAVTGQIDVRGLAKSSEAA